jgi:hypothetical protein
MRNLEISVGWMVGGKPQDLKLAFAIVWAKKYTKILRE